MVTNTLESKLIPYLSRFSKDTIPQLKFYISEYLLTRNKREFNYNLKQVVKTELQKEAAKDLKIMLENDYTARYSWKCICWSVKNNKYLLEAAVHFNLCLSDLYYITDSLENKHKDLINTFANADVIFEPLSTQEFDVIYKKIKKFCSKLLKRLSFLIANDSSLDEEDLKQDLFAHLVRLISTYEHFKGTDGNRDVKKIINYSKRSLTNYAINLIHRGTKRIRARVKNITIPCGICKNCLENRSTRCSNTIQEYQSTIYPIDTVAESSLSIKTKNNFTESEEFITFIKKGLPAKFKVVVDTIVDEENDNPEFEHWLAKQDLQYDTLSIPNVTKLVIQYLGLNETEVKNELSSKYLAWNS